MLTLPMKKLLVFGFIASAILLGVILVLLKQKYKAPLDPLPILGITKTVQKKVGNKTIEETVYHTIGDFHLTDQNGTTVTPETFQDKIYIANFFFTTCPGICPKMQAQMRKVYQKFKDNPAVKLLSHSVDPDYDNVKTLKAYAEKLGVADNRTWHFVTGPKDNIYTLAQKSYFVSALEDKNAPGGIAHSGSFILVDKDKRIRGFYNGLQYEEVNRLMDDVVKLNKAGGR